MPEDCRPLHIQPDRWRHYRGKAYCPLCRRYMGHVRTDDKPTNTRQRQLKKAPPKCRTKSK